VTIVALPALPLGAADDGPPLEVALLGATDGLGFGAEDFAPPPPPQALIERAVIATTPIPTQ
jgi:hypothetical protein